jgi:hypothetical protein
MVLFNLPCCVSKETTADQSASAPVLIPIGLAYVSARMWFFVRPYSSPAPNFSQP